MRSIRARKRDMSYSPWQWCAPDWIFCAQSAACLYGIEQSYQIHDNPMIHIASTHESGIYRARRSDAVIHRVYTPNPQYNVINGAKVTTLPCTIYQCALVLPFEQILPLADSAVRSGMALDDLRQFPVHSATEHSRSATCSNTPTRAVRTAVRRSQEADSSNAAHDSAAAEGVPESAEPGIPVPR